MQLKKHWFDLVWLLCDRKSLEISKYWTEKKARRPHWDEKQPSADAWEDQMRKDCAEIIVLGLGLKKKKVRRTSPFYKKPTPPIEKMTLPELAQLAIARGGTIIIDNYRLKTRTVVEPMPKTAAESALAK
jgi:hypothetical protein